MHFLSINHQSTLSLDTAIHISDLPLLNSTNKSTNKSLLKLLRKSTLKAYFHLHCSYRINSNTTNEYTKYINKHIKIHIPLSPEYSITISKSNKHSSPQLSFPRLNISLDSSFHAHLINQLH